MKRCFLKFIIIFIFIVLSSALFINIISMASTGFETSGIDSGSATFDTNAQTTKVSTLTENSVVLAISIMRIAGVTIAVVMLLVLAMKYMTSSAGDRADIKKHAVVYVVGAFILFGAVAILTVISNFADKTLTTS